MLTQAPELDSESELHSPISEREIFGFPPSRKGALLILAPSQVKINFVPALLHGMGVNVDPGPRARLGSRVAQSHN